MKEEYNGVKGKTINSEYSIHFCSKSELIVRELFWLINLLPIKSYSSIINVISYKTSHKFKIE